MWPGPLPGDKADSVLKARPLLTERHLDLRNTLEQVWRAGLKVSGWVLDHRSGSHASQIPKVLVPPLCSDLGTCLGTLKVKRTFGPCGNGEDSL